MSGTPCKAVRLQIEAARAVLTAAHLAFTVDLHGRHPSLHVQVGGGVQRLVLASSPRSTEAAVVCTTVAARRLVRQAAGGRP